MQTSRVDPLKGIERIKHLEQEIEELRKTIESNERKYRDLYDGAPDLYRTIDINGIILDCNKAYTNYLGYLKEEILGMSIFDHVTDESIDKMRNSFESWKKDGHVESREIKMKRKDGTIFSGLLSATNLYDCDGKLIGSNTVIKDITELCKARQDLEASQKEIQDNLEKLKKTDDAKDEFLAMITHELKTPLVPIAGYADILLSEFLGTLTDPQKERIRIIKSSSETLLKLITELLDAQKIELGKLKLEMSSQDLSTIIENTITNVKPIADRHNIAITSELEKNVYCYCDKDRITQVLTNLIFNSLDFCEDKTGKISIKLNMDNMNAKIVVKDNGLGIEKQNLGKIFVKFYQVNTTTTREHGGTGLGLSVCKGIVENHGGKIWIESEGLNKGTEIHMILPRVTVKPSLTVA